jgi:hypothetical protein
MKPVINLEENIGKTVGRRVVRDAFNYGMGLQEFAVEMQRTLGHPRFPKGVFRFNSFEEADAWTMKYLTQRQPS